MGPNRRCALPSEVCGCALVVSAKRDGEGAAPEFHVVFFDDQGLQADGGIPEMQFA